MEQKLQSVEAEDKALMDKNRAAQKAERDAIKAKKAKNDVYASDRARPGTTTTEVTITRTGSVTLNQ